MAEPTPAPPPPSLDAALSQIDEYLRHLSGGVSFCEDRGFGWTVQSEGWRRDFIVDLFARVSGLATLLPVMGSRLQAGETIADHTPSRKEFDTVVALHKNASELG